MKERLLIIFVSCFLCFKDSAAKVIKNFQNLASTNVFFLKIFNLLIFSLINRIVDNGNLPKTY